MSTPVCCIKTCTNTKVPGSKYSFHYMRFDWTLELQNRGALKDGSQKKLICSMHFKPELVIERNGREFLVPNAVPSLHLLPEKPSKESSGIKNKESFDKSSSKSQQNTETLKPQSPVLESQNNKYKLRKCSVRWKNMTLKCTWPNCGLINATTVYVAQVALNSSRPRFIILCKRHRDVTDPKVYDYLRQRCQGEIISLRQDPIDKSDCPESTEPPGKPVQNKSLSELSELRVLTKVPIVVSQSKGTKRKLEEQTEEKFITKGRVTRSTAPVIEEIERPPSPPKKDTSSKDVTTISKKSKRRVRPTRKRGPSRASNTSDSITNDSFANEMQEDSDTSTPPPTETKKKEEAAKELQKEATVPEKVDPDVICVDSDSDDSQKTNKTDANVLLNRNCCIPGCKSTDTDSIIKVGEAPNFEYLVVCLLHRDCFKNVKVLETVKKPKEYILEEGEVPPSPDESEDESIGETLSNVENSDSSLSLINSSPSMKITGEQIPVQRVRPTVLNTAEPVELNDKGHMLVTRKCISMTGPSGVPRPYILEEWGDGSIVYTPAPTGLPLGNCTKEEIAFYKMRNTRAENANLPPIPVSGSTIQSLQENQILSKHHIIPNPDPSLPIGDASNSKLVYIQGEPFLLTSAIGLSVHNPISNIATKSSSNPILPMQQQQQQQYHPQQSAQKRLPAYKLSSAVSSSSSRLTPLITPKISSVTSLNPVLARKIIRNRIGGTQLSKNLSVKLITPSRSATASNEPEEILSDPIPIALTRVDQGPSQSLQITQKTHAKDVPGPSEQRLPQKTNLINQNLYKNINLITKKTTNQVANRNYYVINKTGKTEIKLSLKKPNQKPPILNSSTYKLVQNASTLSVSIDNRLASVRTTNALQKPQKPSVLRPTLPVKLSVLSQESGSRESTPPIRVTRQSAQITPPKKVTPDPEPKATNSGNKEPKVIKILNLNKETTRRKTSNTEDLFSLPVTSIAAFNENDDDANFEENSNSSTSNFHTQPLNIENDSEDPSDPLSVRTIVTIDLDEADPLANLDATKKNQSATSSSSSSTSKISVRRGSLPFPSSIRKRQ